MCIMGRDDGNTVKSPPRPEDGVTVDPIDPNPSGQGSTRANRNRIGNVRSSNMGRNSGPASSGKSRAQAAAKSRRSSKGKG